MTYFLLSITNTCNKSCGYCAVKLWLNNPEYPDKIATDDIIKFLGKEMKAGDAVELTGGEPTLFPGLMALLDWLKKHKVKTIMRTNGFRLGEWRKDYPNMIVVLAKHDSDEKYMQERKKHLLPQDLVLDGIPEHVKQTAEGKPVFVNDETSPLREHPFKRMLFVTNDGRTRCCPSCEQDMGTAWDFKPRLYHCCQRCSYMLGAWNLAARLS